MARKHQEGQILLIVVLTMIVALTVGLSMAARVVTELKLSKQNEESQRAFQAAEAGIQQTLENRASISVPVPLNNNSSFSTTYEADIGTAILMNNGLEVDQTTGGDVWLSDYSADPSEQFENPMGCTGGLCNPVTITIYWGSTSQTSCLSSAGSAVAPAIEVTILKGPKNNPTIQKSIFETFECWANNRSGSINNPDVIRGTTGSFTLNNQLFRNSASLTFGGSSLSNGLIMKVIPIFNSSLVGFQSQNTVDPSDPYSFPAQGTIVTSTGTSGDTVRKVEYFQSFPQMPLEIFPYSLISQ